MRRTIFVWTLLLLACGAKPTADSKSVKDDSVMTSSNDEEFDKFFEKFKQDSLFQIEGVRFPLMMVSWDFKEDKPATEKLEVEDWRHLKFEYQESFATRQIDAYTQETKVAGDSTRIELRGVDNGIHIDYNFAKVNGNWFLISEKDFSD